MNAPSYKAQGFNSLVLALREMCSPDGFAAFVEVCRTADPEIHRLLENAPPASTWLPLRLETAFHDLTLKHVFAGDIKKSYEIGHRSAMIDFRGVYRTFIKFLSVDFLIARTNVVWGMYYRGNGQVRAVSGGRGSGDVIYTGIPFPSAPTWENYRGGMAAMLELTRVKSVMISLAEGGGSSPDGRFHVRWT